MFNRTRSSTFLQVSPVHHLVLVILGALLLSASSAAGQQTRYIFGAVLDGNDQGVAQTEVRTVGGQSDVTTVSGGFKFPLLPPLKVGFPVTFQVLGWAITDPCTLARGRTYLPDPDAESITLKVLRPGDPRLLSGRSIRCIVEEEASRFEAKPASGGSPHSSLEGQQAPFFAGTKGRRTFALGAASGGDVGLVYVALVDPPSRTTEANTRSESDPPLAPQAEAQAEALGFTPEQLTQAIDKWAKSSEDLYERGLAALYERRYPEASGLISESIPSPPGKFIDRYVPLARAEYEQGHYAAAESALRTVLQVHEDDPLVLNNLGVVLLAAGRYSEAEPLLNRALAIDKVGLGPDHPDVATDLNNLAALYYYQGKYAAAEPLQQRALKIGEKALGPDHPKVATRLNNLAMLYDEQGKYAAAEPLQERALKIDEKALGPDHPDVARDLNNLALLYDKQGKYAAAEPLYQRALKIDEKALGPDHPKVGTLAEKLAHILGKLGRDAEAKVYEQQAARIRAKTSR